MEAVGNKIDARYSRSTSSFPEKQQLGIVVPMDDYKFLKSYDVNTLDADYIATASTLGLKSAIGDEISSQYVYNLDDEIIKNAILGPSSGANSKGITQIRPGKQNSSTIIAIDKQSSSPYSADTLRMNMNEDDNVILAKVPDDFSGITYGTVRSPYMANVSGHANSLIINYDDGHLTETISFPMTDVGSINPNYTYRFSFYYRAKGKPSGTLSVKPIVSYFTNSGSSISTHIYGTKLLSLGDTELSDFRFFEIIIPTLGIGYNMPENTKRIQVDLQIVSQSFGGTTVFEIMYPILEHSFGTSLANGYIFMMEEPSDFSGKMKSLGDLVISDNNMNMVLNNTKLFPSHIGRDLYEMNFKYDIMDATFLYHLRTFEQMNNMGYSIALRPMHPGFPPVMIGDIKISNQNNNYDYRFSDVDIKFTEIE